MKKKQTPPVTETNPDKAAEAVADQISTTEATVPQIEPAPAPSYAQAVAKTAATDENSDGPTAEREPQEETEQEESTTTGQQEEPMDDDSYGEQYAASSSAYRPSELIPKLRQPTSANFPRLPAGSKYPVLVPLPQVTAKSTRSYPKPLLRSGKAKPYMDSRKPTGQRLVPPKKTTNPVIQITSKNVTAKPLAPQPKIFPLRFGTTSPYVKEVQRKLGLPATGYYGTMTRQVISKRYGTMEISEALYKQIITGKAPVSVPPAGKRTAKPVRKPGKPTKVQHGYRK